MSDVSLVDLCLRRLLNVPTSRDQFPFFVEADLHLSPSVAATNTATGNGACVGDEDGSHRKRPRVEERGGPPPPRIKLKVFLRLH